MNLQWTRCGVILTPRRVSLCNCLITFSPTVATSHQCLCYYSNTLRQSWCYDLLTVNHSGVSPDLEINAWNTWNLQDSLWLCDWTNRGGRYRSYRMKRIVNIPLSSALSPNTPTGHTFQINTSEAAVAAATSHIFDPASLLMIKYCINHNTHVFDRASLLPAHLIRWIEADAVFVQRVAHLQMVRAGVLLASLLTCFVY